ncbi:MAG TPA: hypothetical protein VI937_03020 [Negativicutes bacterium]|nr:hypothetical protein [Negativicutes bacterium]
MGKRRKALKDTGGEVSPLPVDHGNDRPRFFARQDEGALGLGSQALLTGWLGGHSCFPGFLGQEFHYHMQGNFEVKPRLESAGQGNAPPIRRLAKAPIGLQEELLVVVRQLLN